MKIILPKNIVRDLNQFVSPNEIGKFVTKAIEDKLKTIPNQLQESAFGKEKVSKNPRSKAPLYF